MESLLPGGAASGMQGKVSSEGQGCCQFANKRRQLAARTVARSVIRRNEGGTPRLGRSIASV